MSTPRTLAELRDIRLPPPPTEAGLDPLWLAAAALGALALLLAALYRWVRRRGLRASLRELAAAERAWAADRDTVALLRTASRLLRRHARRADRHAAALVGADWLAFLDAHSGGGAAPSGAFSAGPGACLADGPYRPPAGASGGEPVAVDVASVVALVKRWLRSHP
jgi:Zn-dependent protease with chaperone function